jgi:hypothetical protein
MAHFVTLVERAAAALHRRAAAAGDERGDVPGWVMITIMTAGIVAVLWQFVGPYLQEVLQAALRDTVGRG